MVVSSGGACFLDWLWGMSVFETVCGWWWLRLEVVTGIDWSWLLRLAIPETGGGRWQLFRLTVLSDGI